MHITNGVEVGRGQKGGWGRDSEGRGGCWVETVVGEERGLVGGGVGGIVVGKFSNWQPSDPISVLRLHVGTEDLFNGPVSALSLSVRLGVMG